ncbi:MAG TPA: hypothetical protein DIT04_07755 [Dysgonomonas sp.]|nr:hypothetical protein [Dysgonomonas sp.]
MLKKLVILFLVLAPLGLFAQDKLAYINTQEIFSQMPELKDVESKLATKQEEVKKNMTALESEYTAKITELVGPSGSAENLTEDQQKQLADIQQRYQTYVETSEKEFGELRQQLLTPLQQKMQKAIQEVGAENGFTYILELGVIPYTSTSAIDAGKMVKAKLGIN